MGMGVQSGCDLAARIPSDTDRVARGASAPELESCAFVDVAVEQVIEMLLFPTCFAGVRNLGITKFEAKISQENEASICMFKKLHFKEVR